MKKNLLFTAMAVAVLASCSNDDVVDVNNGSGISFRASLDKAITRSNVTNLQNLAAFNVTAIGNGANFSQTCLSLLLTTVLTGQLLLLTIGQTMRFLSSPTPLKLPAVLLV